MDIAWIIDRISAQHYRWPRHADRERQNDALTLAEVEQALLAGRFLRGLSRHRPRRELPDGGLRGHG
jgi:hypothetical protein